MTKYQTNKCKTLSQEKNIREKCKIIQLISKKLADIRTIGYYCRDISSAMN